MKASTVLEVAANSPVSVRCKGVAKHPFYRIAASSIGCIECDWMDIDLARDIYKFTADAIHHPKS